VLQEVLDQINLEAFKVSKHMNSLQDMLDSQDFKIPILGNSIPKIGYIAMLGDQPLAAGFLRRVECDIVAQIDGLTSNKAFGSILRHRAIDLVVDQLILEAKELKLQGLIAFTHDKGVLSRAKDRGFSIMAESLISLTIPHL
jgi:hypothetical protein